MGAASRLALKVAILTAVVYTDGENHSMIQDDVGDSGGFYGILFARFSLFEIRTRHVLRP